MSGDYSRTRFDPRKHFTGVLMQQGRVQLDSDWNEMVLQFDRRFRAERSDTLLRHIVPRRTPDAFRVRLGDGKLRGTRLERRRTGSLELLDRLPRGRGRTVPGAVVRLVQMMQPLVDIGRWRRAGARGSRVALGQLEFGSRRVVATLERRGVFEGSRVAHDPPLPILVVARHAPDRT